MLGTELNWPRHTSYLVFLEADAFAGLVYSSGRSIKLCLIETVVCGRLN